MAAQRRDLLLRPVCLSQRKSQLQSVCIEGGGSLCIYITSLAPQRLLFLQPLQNQMRGWQDVYGALEQ